MRHFLLLTASLLTFASLPARAEEQGIMDSVVEAVKKATTATETTEETAKPAEAKTDEAAMQAPAPTKLTEELAKIKNTEAFVKLLKKAGMNDLLKDTKEYTLFVPTNAALDKIEKTVDALEEKNNKEQLVNFLKSHIVEGKIARKDLDNNTSQVLTVSLQNLKVTGSKGKLTVNDIKIDDNETTTSNGIVYLVSGVLAATEVAAPAPTPVAPEPEVKKEEKAEEKAETKTEAKTEEKMETKTEAPAKKDPNIIIETVEEPAEPKAEGE